MSHFEGCLMGRILLLGEVQPCCPIQALNGLNETHIYQGGQSALLSLWISMLISLKNTLMKLPE